MGHEKVFGFCENLCNVEVPALADVEKWKENVYNENMLINCDDLQNNSVGARYNVQSTIKPNVELNSMACTGWGATPNPQGGHSNSGSLKMKYRESAISGHGDFDPVLPVTLQVRFYNDQTGEFKDRVMVFESLADSSSQFFNLDADPAGGIPNPIRLTFRISLTNNEVVITWSTNAAFSSMYTVSIVGAKLERGTSPSPFEVGNGLSTGNLMLNLASDVAKFGIENHQINSLTTSEKTIPLAINQLNSYKVSAVNMVTITGTNYQTLMANLLDFYENQIGGAEVRFVRFVPSYYDTYFKGFAQIAICYKNAVGAYHTYLPTVGMSSYYYDGAWHWQQETRTSVNPS